MLELRPALLGLVLISPLTTACGAGEESQEASSKEVNSSSSIQSENPGQLSLEPQLAPGMGELRAHVTLRDSGEPVEGILVRLLWQTDENDQNDTGRVFRRTDQDGRCSFEVEGGTVISSITVEPTATTAPAAVSVKRPIITGKISSFEFALVPGGILSGIVLDESGEPLANADLKVWYSKHGEVERNPKSAADVEVNAGIDGVFIIGGMPAGEFVLSATVENQVCVQRVGGVISEAQVLDGFELLMEPANEVLGMVVSTKGDPIHDVLLVAGMIGRHAKRDATAHDDCWYYPAQQYVLYSQEDGSFLLTNVPSGQAWVIDAKHKSYQPLRQRILPGETVVDLNLVGGMQLDGVVVDTDGQPVSKARMLLGGDQERERRCQKNGKFVFSGLVEDWESSLAVHKPGFAPILLSPLRIDGESTAIEVVLVAGALMEGQVIDADGAGVAGVRIRVVAKPALERFGLATTISGPNGNFFLPDLPSERLECHLFDSNNAQVGRFEWQAGDSDVVVRIL